MLCHIHDLGIIEYPQAWELQNRLSAEIARGERPPTLLLLEHPHTYTFGRTSALDGNAKNGQAANLLWGEQQLRERGIAVHWVDRGGDVTYHGPGQLVGYPLLPLGKLNEKGRIPEADYVGYVRRLETMLIDALAQLGLVSGQLNGKTGVWIQADVASRCARCRPEDRKKPAKIAAIGVKVDAQGITRHGFALNVNPDMSFFDGIIPCGIPDYPVISLADLFSPTPSMEKVKAEIVDAFAESFHYQCTSVKI